MTKRADFDWSSYQGIRSPRYTQTPDEFFDIIAPHLSESELRVMLYIIRKTFGWKADEDDISISQMVAGVIKRNGERLDHGTGLSKSSVIRGVKGLVDKGLIVAQKNTSAARGHEATTYRIRLFGESRALVSESDKGAAPLVSQSDKGRRTAGARARQALVSGSDTQETSPQETSHNRQKPATEKRRKVPVPEPKQPMWQRLDPVADRDAILADRLHRPEVPSLSDVRGDVDRAAAWQDLQDAWDRRRRR